MLLVFVAGLTNIPVVNLTQQPPSYDMEQFSAVTSEASNETEKRDSQMQSSVSSDSQEGEDGFHDARTDAQTDENNQSNVKDIHQEANDHDTSESTVGESD